MHGLEQVARRNIRDGVGTAAVYDKDFFVERRNCPVCTSARSSVLYCSPMAENPIRGFLERHYKNQGTIDWKYLVGTDYVLCDCAECGLIYQRYAPTEILVRYIYNHLISPSVLTEIETDRLTIDNFEKIAGELSCLFRLLDKHPTKIRFLDYGFGHARWARVAKAMGAKVFGTELSSEKIALARTLGIEIVPDEVLVGMRFDLVHTEQVFEHLVAPAHEFHKLAKVLSCDGILKVAIPPQGSIRRQLKAHGVRDQDYTSILVVGALEHLNAFSPRSMQVLAKRYDLRLTSRVRRQTIPFDPWGGVRLAGFLARVSRVTLRPLRRDSGYYLFRR